ncbi:uncharacterized protein LOC143825514 [Paroedura picta]|uniref:uncharacterized protein LOC143825514 n=1 Tax=Paroedura picta TaxID=143630 RepID=UPI004056E8ED
MFTFQAFLVFGCCLLPCLTAGNDNANCVFPFIFDGKRYSSCTTDGTIDEQLWCATTGNFNRDSKWKHCSLEEYGGNSNGKPCIFPFVYKNRIFYTCTDEGQTNGRFWCSTTSNFDLEPQWSYCADTRLDANPKGPCVFPFLYNGTSYTSCTTDGISNKKFWCSLTSNYDVDLKWTYCEPSGRSKVETGIFETTSEKTATLDSEKADQRQVTQVQSKRETGVFKSTTERGATSTTGKLDHSQATQGRSKFEKWIFQVLTEKESTLNTGKAVPCPGKMGGSESEPEIFELTTGRVTTLDTGKAHPGQTTKGPDENMESPPCVFPFIYKGKSYQSCTTDGWSDGTFWCALTSNYDVDKKWKFCQITGPDPDVESPPCTFPFIYKGKSYSACTAEGMSDGKLWCATTSTYDVDKKWIYCNITGPDTRQERPSCVFPFIYNGQNYRSCTEDGQADGKLWCSTTRNYDVDKQRTFCTVTKTGCVFPFIYKERAYQSCIPVGRTDGKAWCSTTPNLDTGSTWRFCNESDCAFPFVFRGKTYHSCTTSGHLDGKLSCPLISNPETDRMWLLCDDTGKGLSRKESLWPLLAAKKEYGGNSDGKPCEFPFIYLGRTYYTCTTKNSKYAWCATTGSYDRDGKWSYCADTRSTGQPCVFPYIYENISRTTCVIDNSPDGEPWCSQTKNYDVDRKRIYCAASGNGCIFPFIYRGKKYCSCTSDGSHDGQMWCATTSNYDRDRKWRTCVLEDLGGNANGETCVIPFIYKEKTYNGCTRVDDPNRRSWCATTPSYDKDGKWTYCDDSGVPVNKLCVFPFNYKGKTYLSCTRDGSFWKRSWCSLTSDYDTDRKWKYCEFSDRKKGCSQKS